MRNVLDYTAGFCPNRFALDDIFRNVESIIDAEPAGEFRQKMLAEFRAFKIANQRFGMYLLEQDTRLFGWKK
jgi:hypothetical protein